jgi:anti-anti-sigma regulatory factor
MPTEIKQIDDSENNRTILRVSGEMFHDDAELIERIATAIHVDTGHKVTIDLADLDFLDSDAASILKRLAETAGFSLEGIEIFLQSAVNDAERLGP